MRPPALLPQPSPAQAAAAATTNPSGAGETPALRDDGETIAPHDPDGPPRDDDRSRRLSPAVRRAVLEYHVDPTSIRGTGKDGRLTKDDVIAAAQAQKTAAASEGPAQRRRLRQASAPAQAGPNSWRAPASGAKSASR